MSAIASKSLHTAYVFFSVHFCCALVFGFVYSIINSYVVGELVRRALSPNSTHNERRGLKEAISRSSLVREVVAKQDMTKQNVLVTVLGIPLEIDDGATLNNYQDRTFSYWLMNSLLIQAGVGGSFAHLSVLQRITVIVQTTMVLAISAFAVAYSSI